MKKFLLVLAAQLSILGCANVPVATSDGTVLGYKSGNTVVFKGIPYAAPPIGNLRFAPPQKHAPWSSPLKAKAFGSKCPQIDPLKRSRDVEGSEDCLYLNVWQPRQEMSKPVPVMVFIHGGGNVFGSASDRLFLGETYDGEYLSEQGPVVVVTMNYRLGPLGFLAHPDLSKASEYHGSGNYGILDQLAALRWVKANAAAFGGDPNNITVFGESAGGMDIFALLASPLAKRLFARAIVESGPLFEAPLKQGEDAGRKFSAAVGCETVPNSIDCLRAVSTEKMVSAAFKGDALNSFLAVPMIDGKVLTAPILKTLIQKKGNLVPLLIGTNADEMTTIGPMFGTDKVINLEMYDGVLKQIYEKNATSVLEHYQLRDFATPRLATEAVLDDFMFHCPARRVARALTGSVPVWKYVFTHVPDSIFLSKYRAGHTLELPFVFNTSGSLKSSSEKALAQTLAKYWLNFARTGDPNSAGLPAWPPHHKDEYVNLDLTVTAGTGFRKEKCDLLDSFGPVL